MDSYHYLLCIKLETKGENFLKTGNPKGFIEICDLFKSWAENRPKCPVQVGVDIIIDFPAFVRAGSPRSTGRDVFYRIATPRGTCFIDYPSDINNWFNICDMIDNGKIRLLPWTELKNAIELDAAYVTGMGRSYGEAAFTTNFFRGY